MQITALRRNGKYNIAPLLQPLWRKQIAGPSYRIDIADACSLSGSNAKSYHRPHIGYCLLYYLMTPPTTTYGQVENINIEVLVSTHSIACPIAEPAWL